MPAYKDAQKGTWYAAFYYQDWKGIKKKKLKRGFPTKKEALAWERTFLLQQAADLTMTFEAFVEIYLLTSRTVCVRIHGLLKSISFALRYCRTSKKNDFAILNRRMSSRGRMNC